MESPLSGSILLAGIVLKLGLYGILRLLLPILPQASFNFSYVVYVLGAITIIYSSLSTLRTTDVKEIIAYSSVAHAAVYLMGVFSNTIQGIEGAIMLGLAHGFVSPGLFICAGVLYDRAHTRSLFFYRGIGQLMPLFSIMFFILSLANCGAPLTLNFVGEFMSLAGIFERLPFLGLLASTSIIFSAAYSIYLYNRIVFGGSFSLHLLNFNFMDLTKREFIILFILISFTIILGIYPNIILEGLHYNVTNLIYSVSCETNNIF